MNIKARYYSVLRLFKKLTGKLQRPKLCTVTFIFDCKGVFGAGKNKKETVFAYVTNGIDNTALVKLFNPHGLQKANCVITNIIVIPIETV